MHMFIIEESSRSRGGRFCAASARRWRCRCSMRWCPRCPPHRRRHAALRLPLRRQRRHPGSVDADRPRARLRADADPQAARDVQERHQRRQRSRASAGRHVRRRHRRPPARLGRLAHRRSRVRSDAARHRGQARDIRRSDHRAADRQEHAGVVARAVGRLPDAGRVRLGRLLLREHGLVAQRDHAEPDRAPSARRVRTAVRRRRNGRRAARAHPQDGQHSRFREPGSQPPRQHARRGRSRQARRVPRLGPRHRAAHSERRAAGRARRSSCRTVRWTFPRRSTSTPS